MVNQAHHHHHQGQNTPHQRQLLTHMSPPQEPPQPDYELLGGSEGLIGPPLPCLDRKDVPALELLLYNW